MSGEKELKPCPFCCGEGQIKTEIDGDDILAYIFCNTCYASTDKFIDVDFNGKNIDYAKNAWNRRLTMDCKQNSNVSWLISCPCNDGNFKIHLKSASDDELRQVIDILPSSGNKTKLKVINAELNRRNNNGNL